MHAEECYIKKKYSSAIILINNIAKDAIFAQQQAIIIYMQQYDASITQ